MTGVEFNSSFPAGMALSYNAQLEIKLENYRPPYPVLVVLTIAGMLSFYTIADGSQTEAIAVEATSIDQEEDLPTPRPGDLGDDTPTAKPATSSTVPAFGSAKFSLGATDSKATIGAKKDTTGDAAGATKPAFGAGAGTSLFGAKKDTTGDTSKTSTKTADPGGAPPIAAAAPSVFGQLKSAATTAITTTTSAKAAASGGAPPIAAAAPSVFGQPKSAATGCSTITTDASLGTGKVSGGVKFGTLAGSTLKQPEESKSRHVNSKDSEVDTDMTTTAMSTMAIAKAAESATKESVALVPSMPCAPVLPRNLPLSELSVSTISDAGRRSVSVDCPDAFAGIVGAFNDKLHSLGRKNKAYQATVGEIEFEFDQQISTLITETRRTRRDIMEAHKQCLVDLRQVVSINAVLHDVSRQVRETRKLLDTDYRSEYIKVMNNIELDPIAARNRDKIKQMIESLTLKATNFQAALQRPKITNKEQLFQSLKASLRATQMAKDTIADLECEVTELENACGDAHSVRRMRESGDGMGGSLRIGEVSFDSPNDSARGRRTSKWKDIIIRTRKRNSLIGKSGSSGGKVVVPAERQNLAYESWRSTVQSQLSAEAALHSTEVVEDSIDTYHHSLDDERRKERIDSATALITNSSSSPSAGVAESKTDLMKKYSASSASSKATSSPEKQAGPADSKPPFSKFSSSTITKKNDPSPTTKSVSGSSSAATSFSMGGATTKTADKAGKPDEAKSTTSSAAAPPPIPTVAPSVFGGTSSTPSSSSAPPIPKAAPTAFNPGTGLASKADAAGKTSPTKSNTGTVSEDKAGAAATKDTESKSVFAGGSAGAATAKAGFAGGFKLSGTKSASDGAKVSAFGGGAPKAKEAPGDKTSMNALAGLNLSKVLHDENDKDHDDGEDTNEASTGKGNAAPVIKTSVEVGAGKTADSKSVFGGGGSAKGAGSSLFGGASKTAAAPAGGTVANKGSIFSAADKAPTAAGGAGASSGIFAKSADNKEQSSGSTATATAPAAPQWGANKGGSVFGGAKTPQQGATAFAAGANKTATTSGTGFGATRPGQVASGFQKPAGFGSGVSPGKTVFGGASTQTQGVGGNTFSAASRGGGGGFGGSKPAAFGGGATASSGDQSVDAIAARLSEIYQQHDPSKVASIPAMLQKYAGHEAALLARVEKKYLGAAASPGAPNQHQDGFGQKTPQQSSFGNQKPSTFGGGFGAKPTGGFGQGAQSSSNTGGGFLQKPSGGFGGGNTSSGESGGGGGLFKNAAATTPAATRSNSMFTSSGTAQHSFGGGGGGGFGNQASGAAQFGRTSSINGIGFTKQQQSPGLGGTGAAGKSVFGQQTSTSSFGSTGFAAQAQQQQSSGFGAANASQGGGWGQKVGGQGGGNTLFSSPAFTQFRS